MRDDVRLAVLGSPIAHSKSPALHAAAYAELGLEWSYGRQEVTDEGLEGFLAGLDSRWRGLSLTMPLKRRVAELVPEVDAVARATHQGNTILLDEGRPVKAFNTDVHGVVAALAGAGVTHAERALVLGGGATAESAVAALHELGATVTIAVRDPRKVESSGTFGPSVHIAALDAVSAELAEADAVVSTIPNGTEFALPIPAHVAGTLLDVAYHPWPSGLAERWTLSGGTVVSGIEMLLHQAVHQVRIFVSGDPAVALPDEVAVIRAMRAAVE